MLLSIYTFVKNGMFYDFHVVDMLKHHLPFADEIIVNEGYSSDDTYERISQLDPKIKIFRSTWGEPKDTSWYLGFKDSSRQKCQGEWCLLLDCDEFIPEWEFARIRDHLAHAQEDLIPAKVINFYGNYQVYHAHPEKPNWPARKMILHRNRPEIEVWGDGSNVRIKGQPFTWETSSCVLTCHHFGFVRHAARLRQKWRNTQHMYSGRRTWLPRLPTFLFNLLPHDWMDPQFLDDLALYEGPYLRAVRENPEEFIRDGLALARYLSKKPHRPAATPEE